MSNPETISPAEFLALSRQWPVIDVRSPSEYRQGHIPGAVSIPLFDDPERAIVGTTYTRQGHDDAVRRGLELVGHKLAGFVKQAGESGVRNHALVHCWRGGMRSEAMAWLFRFTGIQTRVLEGGYKAYRRHIRASFESGPPLKILGGMTGSGKTEVLQEMAALGGRVIDLEALASHKGSAFGGLGQAEQPTTEQFENDLARQWMEFTGDESVWVEDESLNIGRVVIPGAFFQKMKNAPLLYMDVAFAQRVERLVRDYGHYDSTELARLIQKISRRMGGDLAGQALQSLESGDLRQAIAIVLSYYDKTYRYSLEQRVNKAIQYLGADESRSVSEWAVLLKTTR